MQFAIDENGIRTSINNSIKGKLYKCPCCGTEVIQKKGDVMIWHFAHKSLADCVDYYDNKGEWHRSMQELFPEQNREVYEKTETYRHIFDVLTDKGRIIEFQHSPMSFSEFQRRTLDYHTRSKLKKTQKPVWVFDFSERDFQVSSKKYDSNPRLRKFFWKRSTNIFRNYNNFKWEEWYELWIFIKPYDECKSGFVRVMSTYNECKVIVGEVYNEQQFKKYITSL